MGSVVTIVIVMSPGPKVPGSVAGTPGTFGVFEYVTVKVGAVLSTIVEGLATANPPPVGVTIHACVPGPGAPTKTKLIVYVPAVLMLQVYLIVAPAETPSAVLSTP
ncbi:MAG: hypothetical protein APG09_00752 [Candidatus Methanofastidiosum methylothiophilum]|uniref:Uncharacterized protein n=1 Tax=Candidatus Methanofastidiosum methylothiophilum TaxID=1705564 RepID=A0A150JLN4_9EURY|nr:MAG: hypothetical protein APG09_00752 [Candidatus Methanofastidiosum methylthiophilus]